MAQRLQPGQQNKTKESTTAPQALLECFVANPRNPRRSTYRRIQNLADSMRRVGQLQAVVTISKERWGHRWREDLLREDFTMTVQMVTLIGSSRLQAAPLAGMEFLAFSLRDDLMEHPDGPLLAAALENLDREEFSLMDKARLCVEIAAEIGPDATNDQVSAKLNNRGEKWVSQHKGLMRLCQPIQDQIDSGDFRISLRMAREIAPIGKDLPEADRQTEQLKALKALGILVGSDPEEEGSEFDETVVVPAGVIPAFPEATAPAVNGRDTAVSLIVPATNTDAAASLPAQRRASESRPVSDKAVVAKLKAYLAGAGRRPEDVGVRLREVLESDAARVEAIQAIADDLDAASIARLVQHLSSRPTVVHGEEPQSTSS